MENNIRNNNRHIYLDIIRLVSCILVVFIHVSAMEWVNYPVDSFDWHVMNALNCIGMNGVPLFFMISGALILNEEYKITYKKLFVHKIGKLLLAYYVAVFFYNLLPFLKGWAPWEAEIIKEGLVEGTIYEGGVYHLWFIPVLAVLYLLAPILKEAFRSKKICEYYLILYTIIGAVIPTILLFDFAPPLKRFVSYYEEKASLFMVTGYIGYFVLGHYLHTFAEELTKRKRIVLGILIIAASIFTIGVCSVDALQTGYPSSLANTPLSINMLLSSSGIYLLAKHYGGKITSERVSSVLGELSKYTFGIYLLHPFVMDHIPFVAGLKDVIPDSLLLTVVRILLVTVITAAIVFVLKKIPGIKKIL